jgi:hypothetical protein
MAIMAIMNLPLGRDLRSVYWFAQQLSDMEGRCPGIDRVPVRAIRHCDADRIREVDR